MEANKAPEKIWMNDDWFNQFDDKDFMSEDSVEYIRKDVFIKKACEYLFENYHGEKLSLRRIKNFKNYMEGK